MQLKNPWARFEKLYPQGESIKVSTAGKKIVLPTGNPDLFPIFNEYAGNPQLVSIAESPFGGLKGSGAPDYCPGTVFVNSGDGIYLTDINGQNTTKTLTAGKLIELGNLTVDTAAHTITEEFIIENTSASNNPTTLSACEDTTNWTAASTASQAIDSTNFAEGAASLKLTCTTAGEIRSTYNPTGTWDFSAKDFLVFQAKGVAGKTGRVVLSNDSSNWVQYSNISYNGSWQTFVIPLKIYQYSGGTPNFGAISYFYISMQSAAVGDTLNLDNIRVDVGIPAYMEIRVPDNLADTSLIVESWDGAQYNSFATLRLDQAISYVSTNTIYAKFLDGSLLNTVYGSVGSGRAFYPKSIAGSQVAGAASGLASTITYSQSKGVKCRIGLGFLLPPSDNRTGLDKIRLKLVIYYNIPGVTTYEFEDSNNASYGLQNMVYPWIPVYDPDNKFLDYFLFTYKPKGLVFKRDETGTIYEVELFPGNGSISHGRVNHPQPNLDSNSDYIPDCLSIDKEGSIAKLLKTYGFF